MTTEVIEQRFSLETRLGGMRLSLPWVAPMGRLGLVLLVAGWGMLLLKPFIAGASIPEARTAAMLVARFGEGAVVLGVVLALLALLLSSIGSGKAATQSPRVEHRERELPSLPTNAEAPAAPAVATRAIEDLPLPPTLSQAPAASGSAPMMVIARGNVEERLFLVLADGSVVIETLLGQRRFRSVADARDFIGNGQFVIQDVVQIPLNLNGEAKPADAPTPPSASESAAAAPKVRLVV
ncbi:MAG: hypothetical protein ACOYLQ_18970 [Hyphomicrobiaceae bacterium]